MNTGMPPPCQRGQTAGRSCQVLTEWSLFGFRCMVCEVKSCATRRCSTPPGPEGSNGRHTLLCDTGKLDLFLYGPALTGRKRPMPASLASADCGKNEEHNYSFIHFLQRSMRITASLALQRMVGPTFGLARISDRLGKSNKRMSLPGGLMPLCQGRVPSRAENLHSLLRRLSRNWCPYEKRYYHQLNGERTPYRHS